MATPPLSQRPLSYTLTELPIHYHPQGPITHFAHTPPMKHAGASNERLCNPQLETAIQPSDEDRIGTV